MLAKPPILANKQYQEPSVFTAENLLREARRQKSLSNKPAPKVCVLDPDGDIVRYLTITGRGQRNPDWACYHTDLYDFVQDGLPLGIIGCAVGASFAVLVAEELFASGCELLISITSAGQIHPLLPPPYFILIDKALRDEGTSYHYLPPSDYSHLNSGLRQQLQGWLQGSPLPVPLGAAWTTDAPFRETASAIEQHRQLGILAVEMEAAALYAFAEMKQKSVACFAHVTNQMARIEGDFEKGADNGSHDALQLIGQIASGWAAQ